MTLLLKALSVVETSAYSRPFPLMIDDLDADDVSVDRETAYFELFNCNSRMVPTSHWD